MLLALDVRREALPMVAAPFVERVQKRGAKAIREQFPKLDPHPGTLVPREKERRCEAQKILPITLSVEARQIRRPGNRTIPGQTVIEMAETKLRLIAEKRFHIFECLRRKASAITFISQRDEMPGYIGIEIINAGARVPGQVPSASAMVEVSQDGIGPFRHKPRPALTVRRELPQQLAAHRPTRPSILIVNPKGETE
jgi:hypothetical protein